MPKSIGTASGFNRASASSGDAEVLLLSSRRLSDLVGYCVQYEFEDVIREITSADQLEPPDHDLLEYSRRIYRYTRLFSRSSALARRVSRPKNSVRLQRNYRLFFPIFNHPHELFALASVPEWRKHCQKAACFIGEVWVNWLPNYLVEMLSEFDHIFVGAIHPLQEMARITGRPCSYLPLAADVLKFSPYPECPERSIDVCSLGRRSTVTHDALMRMTEDRSFFYYYDTVAASGIGRRQQTFRVHNPTEHRLMLANLLRRSRYYFAYRSLVNDPRFARRPEEISSRYYEGAAAGAVMIGGPVDTPEFREQFSWEDVVLPVPFDSPDIAKIIRDFDQDKQRLDAIRSRNVYHAALRHDWVHRLRTVFERLGLRPTEGMTARENRLRGIAAQAKDLSTLRVVP